MTSSGRRAAIAALAALGAGLGQQSDVRDTYLPWEGGAAYYGKWSNGLPRDPGFFPISVWLQDPATAAEYKSIGVNLFIGLWRGPTEDQLKKLAEAGMPALATMRPEVLDSPNAGVIRGWTLQDEPDNAQAKPGGGWGPCVLPPVIAAQYAERRAADPTRPVFLNLGQGVINEKWRGRGEFCGQHPEHYEEYVRGADIISYDVYPVNSELPLWYAGAGVARLRKWTGYQKPVWNFIETTSIRGRFKPSPAQIEFQVWHSIINGSMGVGYFCHQFKPVEDASAPLKDQQTRRALARINRTISSLAPVLNSPPVANGVTAASSNADSPVETLLKRHGGSTYLFAAGVRPGGRTTASFRLRGCGDLEAEVIGESRSLPVRGGVLEDSFDDYQVHIYRLACDPNPAAGGVPR